MFRFRYLLPRKTPRVFLILGLLLGITLGTVYSVHPGDLKQFLLYWHARPKDAIAFSQELPSLPHAEKAFGGFPQPADTFKGRIRILHNPSYSVGYDTARRNPAWVCYRLFPVSLQSHSRPTEFIPDFRTLPFPPVTSRLYSKTGYDRGHMAPHYGIASRYPQDLQSTFLLSNIVPQKPNLNREPWRQLEMLVAKDWGQRFGELWITTGPIYNDEPEKLRTGIHIPVAFYKIIIDLTPQGARALAFILPQSVSDSETLPQFLTSIDQIETLSHLDFSPKLKQSIQTRLEASQSTFLW